MPNKYKSLSDTTMAQLVEKVTGLNPSLSTLYVEFACLHVWVFSGYGLDKLNFILEVSKIKYMHKIN